MIIFQIYLSFLLNNLEGKQITSSSKINGATYALFNPSIYKDTQKRFVNQIYKMFLKKNRNLCFHKFPELFDDLTVPFRNSHFADSKVLTDFLHTPILIIVQINQCSLFFSEHFQLALQLFQFHFVNNLNIGFVITVRRQLPADSFRIERLLCKMPSVTSVLRLLPFSVLFKKFRYFIGNIYFNTVAIIFNCGFNQTCPFRL